MSNDYQTEDGFFYTQNIRLRAKYIDVLLAVSFVLNLLSGI